ncbi:hypothetical protein Golomagni_02393 [Golovinomyces magnicellulatus]|nr:hypothetical protein Golomagni_02393 [Golovinomyces magnicellulatus]
MLYVEPDYTSNEDTFTIEELDAEEFKKIELDSSFIIHPYQYEDAESDCESSISHSERTDSAVISDLKSTAKLRLSTSQKPKDDCKTRNESAFTPTGYQSFKKKRPLSTDISSDLGQEDQQLGNSDRTEPGGFVRRVRRQVHEVVVRRELKNIDGCFKSFMEKEGD